MKAQEFDDTCSLQSLQDVHEEVDDHSDDHGAFEDATDGVEQVDNSANKSPAAVAPKPMKRADARRKRKPKKTKPVFKLDAMRKRRDAKLAKLEEKEATKPVKVFKEPLIKKASPPKHKCHDIPVMNTSPTTPSTPASSDDESPQVVRYHAIGVSVDESLLGLNSLPDVQMATTREYKEEHRMRLLTDRYESELADLRNHHAFLESEIHAVEREIITQKLANVPPPNQLDKLDSELRALYLTIEANNRIVAQHADRERLIREEMDRKNALTMQELEAHIRKLTAELDKANLKLATGKSELEYAQDVYRTNLQTSQTLRGDLERLKSEILFDPSLDMTSNVIACRLANRKKVQTAMNLINTQSRQLTDEGEFLKSVIARIKKGGNIRPVLDHNPAMKAKLIAQISKGIIHKPV
jgi:hypothetical protein